MLSKSQTSTQDRARFVMTQLAFWLLGAIDGHAKNFSIFMQPGGGYIATPLYDVLSAWPVIGNGHGKIAWQKAKMAMAVPGTKSRHYHLQKIQRRHWKALAEWTRIEGLWSAMLQMLARLDIAIEQVNSSLHHSVSPSMAKQIYDGALLDMDVLIAKEPTAARVLNHLIRLTEPGSGGVVIISRATLGKILGVSDPTVGRAIRVLVEGNWVQRMRVGGAYALAVNRSVAWTGPRGDMEHAVFQAVVVASRSEQTNDALASPNLRRIPTSYKGEQVIAQGDADPPAQEILPGMEQTVAVEVNNCHQNLIRQ